MAQKKFICFAESKPVYRHDGTLAGHSGERTIAYSKPIGQHRAYRSEYPLQNPKLRTLKFRTKQEAQNICDYTNKEFNDNFVVREIGEDGLIDV